MFIGILKIPLKKIHLKRILILIFLLLFSLSFYKFCVLGQNEILAYGTDIDFYFTATRALRFQHAFKVDFECVSGTFNMTNCTVLLRFDSGSLSGVSQDNSRVDISTVADRGFNVQASNVVLTRSDGNYSGIITSGYLVTISWRFLPYSLIDHYFMLSVGMAGIVMLIAGPSWFAQTYIKHGFAEETIERLGHAMLLVILGFGFVVIWLWPI